MGRVRRVLGSAKAIAAMTVQLSRATSRPDVAARFALRHVARSTSPVAMSWHGLHLAARSCDWAALQEVLIEDEYGVLRPYLKASARPVVLDLGANIGTFALFSFSVAPQAAIHSFEPSAETFSVLDANRIRNPQCNWSAHRAAAWGSDGEVSFAPSQTSTAGRVDTGGGETVPAWSLTTIMQRCGGRVDIAKIDIEGAEEAVLCDGAEHLPQIETLVVELHPGRCDTARVSRTLRGSYGRLYQIPGRRSTKPLLLATRSPLLPELPIYGG